MTQTKQLELPVDAAENNGRQIEKHRDDDLVIMSPIPKEILVRLQKFQKQLDQRPKIVIEEVIGSEKFFQLPISYVEHLLKKMYFGLYTIKIVTYSMIVNEITVHVRVKVFHPILGQWMSYDGIAAIPVMQDRDSKVSDFIGTKKKKALALNLPACYSLAIKNACKKIGKVFGGDLNRKHEDIYTEFNIDLSQQKLND